MAQTPTPPRHCRNRAVQEVSIWYEQGMQATANDQSPISGLTATCGGAGAVNSTLEVGCPGLVQPCYFAMHASGLVARRHGNTAAAGPARTHSLPNAAVLLAARCRQCVLQHSALLPPPPPAPQILRGRGAAASTLDFPTGLTNVPVKYGSPDGFLDNLLNVGGSGATVVDFSCQPGEQVAGFHLSWEPAPTAAAASALPPDLATGIKVFCRAAAACPPTT